MKSGRIFFAGLCVLVATSIFAFALGAVPMEWGDAVFQFRLIRVILACVIGFGLGVAGCGLQALFSNPLADPYTVGISSGAALGAVVSGSLGVGLVSVPFGALAGALGVGALLLSHALSPHSSTSSLLLLGLVLTYFLSSLVALWLALMDPMGISGSLSFLLGDLGRAETGLLLSATFGVGFGFVLLQTQARVLDAMVFGEDLPLSLGFSMRKARFLVLLACVMLVAACVASAGIIGFIGLVIPSASRALLGSAHRRLLPLSGILGACALVASDLISRILIPPQEIPVGVITGLFGAPVFIWLLSRRGKMHGGH